MSLCAFLITALFLFVYWRYKLESLSVFIFPLVFVMTLVASLGPAGFDPGPARRCATRG